MTNKLRNVLAAGLTVILGAMLLATIYFTLFDLQWIAFLCGVLFAAVLAVASQASRAQWLIARRTKQWLRTKEALSEEVTRRQRLAETLKMTEARADFIHDALPVMLLFVDRIEYCRYHNRAFAGWIGRDKSKIHNLLLHDVLAPRAYEEVKSRSDAVLGGMEARFDTAWRNAQGVEMPLSVAMLPFPGATEHPSGFYLLIAQNTAAPIEVAATAAPAHIGDQVLRSGRGDELLYLESLTGQMLGSADPREQLVTALREDHFVLFGQTIRALGAAAPYPRCFEILLRLQQEEDNMVPPGGFIPVAEHYGMMGEIDRWVVRNVMTWALARRRIAADWPLPLFCVNMSSATLADPNFSLYVKAELLRQKFPGGNINFEITEPDLIGQRAAVQAFIGTLRPLGCRFTLDAFGSTRVSFAPLQGMQFDFIKIDGSIIQGLPGNRADVARVRAITLTARKMGVLTIAESVESDATLSALGELGVDYVQGFGIGKPGPLADVC